MTSTKSLLLVWFGAAVLLPFPMPAEEPVHLAVLAESGRELTAADLLTAELSKAQPFQVLERNEIERILREQALSATSRDPLQLGQLLGADGLLLLQVAQSKAAAELSAKLLAVHPGVVLADWRFKWPLEASPDWARLTASHLQPFAPKLRVLAKDAIPIAIVNFRSALQSPEGMETECLLKSLMMHRLIQEPRLFVLERERLELLSQEKSLGKDNSAFWNAGLLLDATLDPRSYSQETLVVEARLTSSKGGAPLTALEVKGSRTNLAQVTTELTEKLMASLNIRSLPKAWRPAEEAARYFEEAQWALKWGLFQEAVAACDASWALGRQTKEVAECRLRACRELATPQWGDSAFMRPTVQNSWPEVCRLEAANRALQLYKQGFQTFLAPEAKPDLAWHGLALDLLSSVSDLLRQFYLFPESRQRQEEHLAEVRQLAREVADALAQHPAYRTVPLQGAILRSGNETRVEYWSGSRELATYQAAKGAYWYDTPDQALAMFRELATSGRLHRLRRFLVYRQLIGWTAADQARAPGLWHDFIWQLCTSTNALLRVDGAFMAYAKSRDQAQAEEPARRELYRVAVEQGRTLAAAKLDEQFLKDVNDVLPHSGDRVETQLEQQFRAEFRSVIEFGSASGKMETLRSYFTNNTVFEYHQFTILFYRGDYNAVQARELLPLLQRYQERLHRSQNALPPAYVGDWRMATNAVAQVRESMEAQLLPRPDVPVLRPPPPLLPEAASSALVRVSRFWTLPHALFANDGAEPNLSFGPACYRQGKLWMEVFLGHPLRRAVVLSVDPGSFASELIEMPLDKVGPSAGLEVLDGVLYVSKADGLSRYSLKTKEWQSVPVPLSGQVPLRLGSQTSYVPGHVRLSLCAGRLFLTTQDSLLELNPNGQDVRLLASARRRPALQPLDLQEDFFMLPRNSREPSPLFAGPNQSLRVCIQGKIYTGDPSGNEWSETTSLPPSPNLPQFLCGDDGLLFRQVAGDSQIRWWCLARNQTALELLLAEAKAAPPPQRPRWLLPQGYGSTRTSPQFEGDRLWVLAGELNLVSDFMHPPAFEEQNGRHLLLLKYEPAAPQPQVTPLWFELPEKTYFAELTPKLRLAGGGVSIPSPQGLLGRFTLGPTLFQPTPEGFIVMANDVPGFWLLPRDPSQPLAETSRPRSKQDPKDALFTGAESGDLPMVKAALAQDVAVDARDDRGWTPLMVAAKEGHAEVVRFLIEHGADATTRSSRQNGSPALCFAVEGNRPELVELFLAHGARVNERSGRGQGTALYLAAVQGKKTAAEVLLAHGAELNAVGFTDRFGGTFTPLMGAAATDHPEMVELFLARGASLDGPNNQGATVLMAAAKQPCAPAVKLLLAKGANVNATDAEGHTALIFAAYNGRSENVKLLLAAGADPKAKAVAGDDFDGRPYDAAEAATMRHFPETAALILAAQKVNGR